MGRYWDKYFDAVAILTGPEDARQRFPRALGTIGDLAPSEVPAEVRSRHEALLKKASTTPQGKMDEPQLREISEEIVDLLHWATEQED